METGWRRERGRPCFVACIWLPPPLLVSLFFASLTALSHVADLPSAFRLPRSSPSVFAKLPYALEETLGPPCRLRSFILLGADNLGSEISPLLFSNGLLSAATSQSPELGDGSVSVRLFLAFVRPFFTSCRDRRC